MEGSNKELLQEPILAPVVRALEYYSDMNQKMEQDKEAVKLKQVGRRISSTIDPKVEQSYRDLLIVIFFGLQSNFRRRLFIHIFNVNSLFGNRNSASNLFWAVLLTSTAFNFPLH